MLVLVYIPGILLLLYSYSSHILVAQRSVRTTISYASYHMMKLRIYDTKSHTSIPIYYEYIMVVLYHNSSMIVVVHSVYRDVPCSL